MDIEIAKTVYQAAAAIAIAGGAGMVMFRGNDDTTRTPKEEKRDIIGCVACAAILLAGITGGEIVRNQYSKEEWNADDIQQQGLNQKDAALKTQIEKAPSATAVRISGAQNPYAPIIFRGLGAKQHA